LNRCRDNTTVAVNESQKWFFLALLAGGGWLLYLLSPVLTPFVAGALIAYLGNPVADRLETRGLSRLAAVCAVFATAALAAILAMLFLLPLLEEQIEGLMDRLPAYAAWIKTRLLPWLRKSLGVQVRIQSLDQLASLLGDNWRQAGGVAAALLASLSRSGAAALSWIMNLLLIPVVTFYLLRDWNSLIARLHDLLPRRHAPVIAGLAAEADAVLGAFLRGQFLVMLALGIIYSVGLWIVGLDLALLIGMAAGLVSFIPYMGALFGLTAACAAAAAQFEDAWAILPVLAAFGVGQTLEGTLLTPRLVGERIGLHPVAVIFAVLAGGRLFGFLGVLLALPAASVIMVLLRHAHGAYKSSALYERKTET
jgi:predicted PurR-regulated permease PerM